MAPEEVRTKCRSKQLRSDRPSAASTCAIAVGLVALLLASTVLAVPAAGDSGGVRAPTASALRPLSDPGAILPGAPAALLREPENTSNFWSNVTALGAGAPYTTYGGSMAFDPALNTTVFLAYNSAYSLGLSFTYQNYNWSTASSAVAQTGAGLAFVTSSDELIAFGGGAPIPHEFGPTVPTNATWSYTSVGWQNLTPNLTLSPPPTANPLLAADGATGGALLLDPAGSTAAAQTWLFMNGSWTNLTASAGTPPPGPSGSDSAMAYDADLGGVIFFGGSVPVSGYSSATNETWEFQAGHWSQLPDFGPPFPTGTVQVLVYDNLTGTMVDLLAPPYLYSANGTPTYLQWGLSGSTWVNETASLPMTPDVGYDPLAVWDGADRDLFYMSGGYDAQSWVLGSTPLGGQLSITPAALDLGGNATVSLTTTGGVPPYQYTYSNLPPGCASENAPILACHPIAEGNFTVKGSVTDFVGHEVNVTASLSVYPALSVHGPIAPSFAYWDQPIHFSVNASGGLPPPTFLWTVSLPGCAPPDAASFTCNATALGPGTASVNVTDLGDPTGVLLRANFTVVTTPQITAFGPAVTPIEAGEPLRLNVTVTGGVPPLTYTYLNLPAGCPSNDTPTLVCTPSGAGLYNVTVRVADADGLVVQGSTNVTVVARIAIAEMQVTPNPATVGSTVSFSYSTSGGSGTLFARWAGLPPGCAGAQTSFSCVVNGSGSYGIMLTVRDGLGGTASANVTLIVQGGLPPAGGTSSTGLSTLEIGALLVAAVIVLAVVLVLSERRRRSRAREETGTDGSGDPSEDEASDQ